MGGLNKKVETFYKIFANSFLENYKGGADIISTVVLLDELDTENSCFKLISAEIVINIYVNSDCFQRDSTFSHRFSRNLR